MIRRNEYDVAYSKGKHEMVKEGERLRIGWKNIWWS